MISNSLITASRYFSMVPIVSTISALTELFFKCLLSTKPGKKLAENNRYFYHIKNKSNKKCIAALVPVLGNIAVIIMNKKEQKAVAEEIEKTIANMHTHTRLQNLSPVLQDNKKIVLAAIEKDHFNLQDALPWFKNDGEVVKAAVTKHGSVIQYANPRFFENRDMILLALKSWSGYEIMRLLHDNKSSLNDDEEIVRAAMNNKVSTGVIQYASERLRKKEELALMAVGKNGYDLEYIHECHQENITIILAALQQNKDAARYIKSESMKQHSEDVAFLADSP